MKKIDLKKFSKLHAYDYETAQQILGACALEKVSLIKYRRCLSIGYGQPPSPRLTEYKPVHIEHAYIWKSLASECWLKASINEQPEYGELFCPPRERGDFSDDDVQELLQTSPIKTPAGSTEYYGPVEE